MARPFKQVAVKDVKEIIVNSFNKLIDTARKSNGTVKVQTLIKSRNLIVESL